MSISLPSRKNMASNREIEVHVAQFENILATLVVATQRTRSRYREQLSFAGIAIEIEELETILPAQLILPGLLDH